MSNQTSDRASIFRTEFARDEQGNFGPGGTIHTKPGDTMELGFSDVVGIGKLADLEVAVRGDSIKFDGVKDVVHISGGHRLIGAIDLNVVLLAERHGRSVVDITVVAPDGSASGIVAMIVEVE